MRVYKRLVRRLVNASGLVALGHYALIPCAVLAIGMRVALVATGGSYLAAYAVGAAMLPFLVGLIAHGSGLCPRGGCAVLISSQPAAEARRLAWWLRHVHHQLTSKVTLGLVGAWFVLTFVLVRPIASGVPVVALLLVEMRAVQVHSRLRPWCPECNGRGPDDDPTPEPPPPGGLGRDVPRERINT